MRVKFFSGANLQLLENKINDFIGGSDDSVDVKLLYDKDDAVYVATITYSDT
jgi:hypothetical protein